MSTGSEHRFEALERLSAAVDGEAGDLAVEQACAAWRDDPVARDRWHCYHLIGDVLRSDELSSLSERDAAFLRSVSARLAQEPAVLAPASHEELGLGSTAARGTARIARPVRWRAWSAPAAAAAGFLLVGGVLLTNQSTSPVPAQVPLAAVTPEVAAIQPVAQVSPPPTVVSTQASSVMDGRMLRDARLQQYLAAHKEFGGATALGVPSGFLRSVTVDTSKP